MTPFIILPTSGFVPEGFFADVPSGLYTGFESFSQARQFADLHTGTATEARAGRTTKLYITRPGIKLFTEDEDTPETVQIWPKKGVLNGQKYFSSNV